MEKVQTAATLEAAAARENDRRHYTASARLYARAAIMRCPGFQTMGGLVGMFCRHCEQHAYQHPGGGAA